MKKQIVLMAIALISSQAFAQDNIPDPVKDGFRKTFGATPVIKWIDRHQTYAARFRQNHKVCYAYFNAQGQWKGTEKNIRLRHIPAAVRAAFNTGKYKSWFIEEARDVKGPDSEQIIMHVNNTSTLDGEHMFNFREDFLLFYDLSGKLVREENKEDDIH